MTNIETVATFDITNLEGQYKIFNAKNSSPNSLKDLDGEILEVEHIAIYPELVKQDNSNEAVETEVTALFTTDGDVWSSVSPTVTRSAKDLVKMKEQLSLDSFKCTIVPGKANSGRTFLSLKLIP